MSFKYNWQLPDWPNFTFRDSGLHKDIADYIKMSSSLHGQVSQLNQDNKSEAYIYLMVEEAIKTSAIEGENLNREEVRSSVARYLDLDLSAPKGIFHKEAGVAALLIDVRENVTQKLSTEMLCRWHALMLHGQENSYAKKSIKIGAYRDGPVEIITGPEGYEVKIFDGPPEDTIEQEMAAFLNWYNTHLSAQFDADKNRHLPAVILSAIAHMWFTSIHPFGDGNGRIARAISEHALFQDFNTPPLFSISSTIEDNRKGYYAMLAESSRINPSTDLTGWITWFVERAKSAQIDAKKKIDFILKKSLFWDHHKHTLLNQRQQKVVDKFFGFDFSRMSNDGLIKTGINSEKYQAITGCASATATRDLSDLVKKQILEPSQTGGRSKRYFLILVDEKPVFNVYPTGKDNKLRTQSINKLKDDIQRNIDFHQEHNRQLDRLIEKYKTFANDDADFLKELKNLIAQLDSD